jgi:hypothetical protein
MYVHVDHNAVLSCYVVVRCSPLRFGLRTERTTRPVPAEEIAGPWRVAPIQYVRRPDLT